MSYLYGNHVLKAHVAKMTEDVPEHQGVIIYSQSDIPLVAAGRLDWPLMSGRDSP